MSADRGLSANHRVLGLLATLLLAATVIRLVLVVHMGTRYYFADTGEYEAAARSILAGHGPGPAFPRAPLYPALMAFGFFLFGAGNYPAVRMLQLTIGVSVVALTMLLGYRLGGRLGAVLAGAGATFAPTLIFTTAMLYPTALYSVLLLAATLVARGLVVRPALLRGALLGLFMFLVWMTDQVAMAPLAAILAWMVWAVRRGGRRLAGAIAIALVVASLLATPWIVYHRRVYGNSAFFMQKAQTVLYFVRSNPAVGGRRAVHDTTATFKPLSTVAFVGKEWRLLREQPLPYMTDYLEEFVHFFKPLPDRITTQNVYTSSGAKLVVALYFLPVLLFFGVGALYGAAPARERLLLVLVPVATAALYALFFTQTRYRIPTEPHMLVLASLGIGRLFPRFLPTLLGEPVAREGAPGAAPRE